MKFLKRLYDVLCDLVAVKTVVMSIVTYVYVPIAPAMGIFGFIMFALGWMSVIGFRYAEKYMHLIKGMKEP